jgi:hypothetical protein
VRKTLLLLMLLAGVRTPAQNAIVLGVSADRRDDGNGGGASVHWVHARVRGTVVAGALLESLAGTRWAYGVAGGSRKIGSRTTLTAEANAGSGRDARGGFRYLLLRGGVSHDIVKQRLSGELEWLQSDVARQQDGILRLGATAMPRPRLTLRASHYASASGGDTSLTTMRGDYDLRRVTAIAGFAYGRAGPLLSDVAGSDAARIRDVFGGMRFGGWTIVATAGRERHRVSLSRRIALPSGDPRP